MLGHQMVQSDWKNQSVLNRVSKQIIGRLPYLLQASGASFSPFGLAIAFAHSSGF